MLIGLTITVVDVLIFAHRTRPSFLLAFTSKIRPRGHELRGVLSSSTRTISLTFTFLRSSFHFCRCCKEGKYSRSQRRQNKSARYCTCRQQRTLQLSAFENLPGGTEGPGCSSSRWFGVKASESFGSSDTFVIGRPLTIDSTSHVNVFNCHHS